MASRRPYNTGALGAASDALTRVSVAVPATLWRVPSAANDNKAPLRLMLRRLVFLVTAAVAIGWLFWAGILR